MVRSHTATCSPALNLIDVFSRDTRLFGPFGRRPLRDSPLLLTSRLLLATMRSAVVAPSFSTPWCEM